MSSGQCRSPTPFWLRRFRNERLAFGRYCVKLAIVFGTVVVERGAPVLRALAFALGLFLPTLVTTRAAARPNTHAPAISTWDPRASSVVVGLGRAVSGDGSFSFASYNANFSSTSGILSAQFGVHYVTFEQDAAAPLARGVSAGGVALISLPLASRFDNGVPKSSFAFYIGGVPTAMFSGRLNFISVPLVLGVGLPFSPSPYVTFRPWVELSPGLNFDTRIDEVPASAAIQAAMDGTLTRDEVEDLVEEGLNIQRETTVGKRAGLSVAVHLGERVDVDLNMMLGAGQPGAISLGAGLVLRWDALVHRLQHHGRASAGEGDADSCAALAARYHRQCRLRAGPRAPHRRSAPGSRRRPAPASAGSSSATPATKKKAPEAPLPARPSAPATRPTPGELPPLQAAPPRSQ